MTEHKDKVGVEDRSTGAGSSWSTSNWAGAAALAGAAIGSAALTAVLMYANQRKSKPAHTPIHPEDAPETD